MNWKLIVGAIVKSVHHRLHYPVLVKMEFKIVVKQVKIVVVQLVNPVTVLMVFKMAMKRGLTVGTFVATLDWYKNLLEFLKANGSTVLFYCNNKRSSNSNS